MAHEHSFGNGLYDKNPNQVLELIRLWERLPRLPCPIKKYIHFFHSFAM